MVFHIGKAAQAVVDRIVAGVGGGPPLIDDAAVPLDVQVGGVGLEHFFGNVVNAVVDGTVAGAVGHHFAAEQGVSGLVIQPRHFHGPVGVGAQVGAAAQVAVVIDAQPVVGGGGIGPVGFQVAQLEAGGVAVVHGAADRDGNGFRHRLQQGVGQHGNVFWGDDGAGVLLAPAAQEAAFHGGDDVGMICKETRELCDMGHNALHIRLQIGDAVKIIVGKAQNGGAAVLPQIVHGGVQGVQKVLAEGLPAALGVMFRRVSPVVEIVVAEIAQTDAHMDQLPGGILDRVARLLARHIEGGVEAPFGVGDGVGNLGVAGPHGGVLRRRRRHRQERGQQQRRKEASEFFHGQHLFFSLKWWGREWNCTLHLPS